MKNLLMDTKAMYVDSWRVVRNHKKGAIFLIVASTILSFGPIIVRLVIDKIEERKS